jgi:hypothetical protein
MKDNNNNNNNNNNNICIRSFIILKLKEGNVGFNIRGRGMKNSTFSHIYY